MDDVVIVLVMLGNICCCGIYVWIYCVIRCVVVGDLVLKVVVEFVKEV